MLQDHSMHQGKVSAQANWITCPCPVLFAWWQVTGDRVQIRFREFSGPCMVFKFLVVDLCHANRLTNEVLLPTPLGMHNFMCMPWYSFEWYCYVFDLGTPRKSIRRETNMQSVSPTWVHWVGYFFNKCFYMTIKNTYHFKVKKNVL